MITLNRERGFEQIESWQQVLELPGFTSQLDHSKNKLKEIIGRYLFLEKVQCGLTSCHQPHGRGFIVTTVSGEVTNIGKDCGSTHFGVEFDEYSRVFTQKLKDYENRQSIASFLFGIERHEADIEELRTQGKGANWVFHTSRQLTTRLKGCPDTIVAEMGKLVRSRSGDIRVTRVATDDELEKMDAMEGRRVRRPQYIDEFKGTVRGIECLYPEFDIREILILDLKENMGALACFDVDQATSRELTHWSKWCQEFDQKLDRAKEAVRSGRELLSRENLAPLYELLRDRSERAAFEKWMLSQHL